ncbi:E3 ubiquitin-protein ligase WAV3-like [Andrographis paniculata]|uniref:E3 ubiquitin-protein ligase WAV3-like n=1 Tax=Andrographis paniculata TaxID=175694 RepID=UPI0021E742F0|nr:E3 ubiquitin-protein ligase WAV3-like [Andrographis paniculata]
MASSSQQEPHPSLYPYNDDDPLPAVDDESNDGDEVQQVRIEAIPHYLDLDASASISSLYVLIKLVAPPMSEFRQELRHAPIDLVIVLDSSQCRYDDSYMVHIKDALHFVIQNLDPFDRLSIVSFANRARIIFPLREMNGSGRKLAAAAAESIVVKGGSANLADGLKQGIRVLEERRDNNQFASIILLSHAPQASPIRDKHFQFPIHAFGIGGDHDAVAMHAASDKSKGSYTFLESYARVLGAISSCMGGLLSVVAQDLRVTAVVTSPVEIKEAYAGGFEGIKSGKNHQVTICAGDFYADQKKEFVVRIAIPPQFCEYNDGFGKAPVVNVVCLYNDLVSQFSVLVNCPLLELDQATTTYLPDEEFLHGNEIHAFFACLICTHRIELARSYLEEGNVRNAKAIISKTIRFLSSLSFADCDDRCRWALASLRDIRRRIGSLEKYKARGRAYMLATLSSLKFQRATTRGDRIPIAFTMREKASDEYDAAPKKMKDSFITDGNCIGDWMISKD